MGLCIADSLIKNNGQFNGHDMMHRFIAWWRLGYNNGFRYNPFPRHSVGLGGNISLSFREYINYYKQNNQIPKTAETTAGDENTSGNGSIMRNAAIPICFHNDIELACKNARKQSLITHQGKEAKECCSLLTYIIVKIFQGENKDQIFNNLGKFETDVDSVRALANHECENGDENRNWDWTVKQYKYSPKRVKNQGGYIGSYAMDNMAMSLNTIYQTTNFKDAMIRIVNIRGDADSVASVVGQIAGALYPLEIPGEWIKTINQWDHGEIALRGYMLARIHKKNSDKIYIEK
jgi:ADP-ribosylglycohydrolase